MENFDTDYFTDIVYPPARKENKKVSVVEGLDLDKIQIKVIASYEQWKALEDNYLKTGGKINFEDIVSFIKGWNKIRRDNLISKTKKFYEENPQEFACEFYNNFIIKSKSENPLVRQAPRSLGFISEVDKLQIEEIKIFSKWVYVYLRYWLKKPHEKRPQEMIKTLDRVYPSWRTNLVTINITICVIKDYFKITDIISQDEHFRQNLIYEPKDKRRRYYKIKTLLHEVGYQATHYPLNKVFTLRKNSENN